MTVDTAKIFQDACNSGQIETLFTPKSTGFFGFFTSCFRKKEASFSAAASFFNEKLSQLETQNELQSRTFFNDFSYENFEKTADFLKNKMKNQVENEQKKQKIVSLMRQRSDLIMSFFSLYQAGKNEESKKVQKELEGVNKSLSEARETAKTVQLVSEIDRKVKAVFYRTMRKEAIQERAVDRLEENKEWLRAALLFWKVTHFPAIETKITKRDMRRIEESCHYEGFVDRLKEDPKYCREFFEFAFRTLESTNADAVQIAVEFPHIMKQLRGSFIDKRIQRLRSSWLRFLEYSFKGKVYKDISLRMAGEQVSLLNQERKIRFATGKEMTIAEVLQSFAKKDDDSGEMEFCKNGIEHCYPKAPRVHLEKEDWWKDLPVFEVLSQEEVEDRYKVHLQSGEGVISVKASRQYTSGLFINGSHSWFQAAVPLPNGKFQVIPIGKYPDVVPYPSGPVETLLYTFKTYGVYFNYPDDNEYYNHRQQATLPFVANEQQMKKWLECMRRDLLAATKNQLYFQAQGNNCAAWIQKVLDEVFDGMYKGEVIPRFFKADITQATGPSVIGKATRFYKRVGKVNRKLLEKVHVFIGKRCGAKIPYVRMHEQTQQPHPEKLEDNPLWKKGELHLPSKLFEEKRAILM